MSLSGYGTTTVTSAYPGQLLADGDGTPRLLVNIDPINSVYLSDRNTYRDSDTSDVTPLGPLNSIATTGDHDVYGICKLGQTVQVQLFPEGTQWSPSPVQTATQLIAAGLATAANQGTQITHEGNTATNTNFAQLFLGGGFASALTSVAGTTISDDMKNAQKGVTTEISALIATGTAGGTPGGVPMLRGTNNLGSGSGQSLLGGNSVTLISSVAVTKPGFEAIFKLNLPAASGTNPFALLGVNWTDSNTGLTVGFKQYILTSGNGAGNALTFYLSGPCRGNQITVTLQNLELASTLTFTWAFNQTGHVYMVDRLLQPAYAATAPVTWTNPGGNPSKGALFMANPTIGGSGQVIRLCAASNAKSKLSVDNGGAANGCAVLIEDPGQLYDGGVFNQSFYGLVAAAGLRAIQEIQMPNGPVQVRMVNQGAGNITPSVVLTAMEY